MYNSVPERNDRIYEERYFDFTEETPEQEYAKKRKQKIKEALHLAITLCENEIISFEHTFGELAYNNPNACQHLENCQEILRDLLIQEIGRE